MLAVLAGMAAKAVATWAAKKAAGAAVDKWKDMRRSVEEKAADENRPKQPCKQTKQQRVEARKKAISNAQERLESNNPPLNAEEKKELKASQERFKRNNEAVEYAKLSAHSYDQYDPLLKGRNPSGPPEGWEVADPAKLGLTQDDLQGAPPDTFRAVVYRNTFGMKPEYTVAFRGTEPKAGQGDVNVDIQNASGVPTKSYTSAKELAKKLNKKIPGQFAVTGHSLGGGLAQAAGASLPAPPPGSMFNSAGAHPEVVYGKGSGKSIPGASFKQFRSPCDPLTAVSGTQDQGMLAATLQGAAHAVQGLTQLGQKVGLVDIKEGAAGPTNSDFSIKESLSQLASASGVDDNKKNHGWYVPPNAGQMNEVGGSYDDQGNRVDCSDLGGQHSVTNLTNGMEREKHVDMLVMEKYGCTKTGQL
jgi:hypothetical protein